MPQERLYAKTLGFFEPALFHIHLAYDVKLDDWKNWPDQAIFTFFHEYIHFLQDITTTSGLYNIYVLDEFIKYDVNYIYSLPKGPFKVPLPVINSSDNVFNNILVRRKTRDGNNKLTASEKSTFAVTGRAISKEQIVKLNGQQVNLAKVTVPTNLGRPFILSGREIRESMADLGQKIAYRRELAQGIVNLRHPHYPYHVVEQLAGYYNSPLIQSEEFLFALCDFSLMYQHPAKVLVQFLEITEQNRQLTDYKTAIAFFRNYGQNVDGHGNPVAFEDIVKQMFKMALNGLQSKFKGIEHSSLRNWFTQIMAKAFAMRIKTPFFISDLVAKGNAKDNPDFNFMMSFLGSPLLTDDNNRYYFYNTTKEVLNARRLSRLKAAGNILYMLNGRDFECKLYDYCKATGGCVNEDCKKQPWTKAKRFCACPFGHLWMGWKLNGYYPV